MKSAAISFYEALKEKAFEEIDLNALDKKTYDLVLSSLYFVIAPVTSLDLSMYKNEQNAFIQLEKQYKEKYSKYNNEELNVLLEQNISDIEFEKISLVKALRNENGGNKNDHYQ